MVGPGIRPYSTGGASKVPAITYTTIYRNCQTEETETDDKINDANSLEYTPENRYNKLRKQVLFEARNDDQLIQNMRLYYLDSIDYSEVVSVLSSEVQRIRFAERIKEFKKDYHNSKML